MNQTNNKRVALWDQGEQKRENSRETLTMKALQIISSALFVFVMSASAGAQTPKADVATFHLGDQVITIPAPNDFEEAASQFESIKTRFTVTEAPSNDMLAVHLPHADCEKLRAGGAASLNFYTKISVPRSARSLDYSAEQFAKLVSEFRKTGSQVMDVNGPTMKETLEHLSKGLSDLNKNETQVDMDQPLSLGEFDTRPNVYSVMLLVNLKAQSGDVKISQLIAGGISFVRIKQRLIFVYTYRKYDSKADVETLRDFTKQWIGQILAAN